jgi:hypothetical protein
MTSGAPSSGERTKDLIKFLKQKKMRNALMHIRNCEVPTDVKQMAKGVMQQHKRLDKMSETKEDEK